MRSCSRSPRAGARSRAIVETTGLPERNMHYYVQQLVGLSYIERYHPLDGRRNARQLRLRIADPLLKFSFRFVFPNTQHPAQRRCRPSILGAHRAGSRCLLRRLFRANVPRRATRNLHARRSWRRFRDRRVLEQGDAKSTWSGCAMTTGPTLASASGADSVRRAPSSGELEGKISRLFRIRAGRRWDGGTSCAGNRPPRQVPPGWYRLTTSMLYPTRRTADAIGARGRCAAPTRINRSSRLQTVASASATSSTLPTKHRPRSTDGVS